MSKKPWIGEQTDDALVAWVVDTEYKQTKSNQKLMSADFESYLSLLDAERTEKAYDWMSQLRLPEFVSHVLTEASMDVGPTFKTRDFAEVYLEDSSGEAMAAAAACKELINRTLNQRHLHYYLKSVRARMIKKLDGRAYAECGWTRRTKQRFVGMEDRQVVGDTDIYGDPFVDQESQVPQISIIQEPVFEDVLVQDRFELEILDNRNVFVVGNEYKYSMQDCEAVIVRSEKTLDELRSASELCGYFNLDLLEEQEKTGKFSETETSQETYNKELGYKNIETSRSRFDVLKRYGKFWCVVKERDENGLPVHGKIKPGIDGSGAKLKNATLEHVIMEFAVTGTKTIPIAFHPTPWIDSSNDPYIPIIRGLCYPHPTEDAGFGDAKHAHDLQIAIDDIFNMAQDRSMFATFPMFAIRELSFEDNSSLYLEPGHFIKEKEQGDIREFKIDGNIQPALTQISVLKDSMQQLEAIFPGTMGRLPSEASTTATAVAGAEGRTDTRFGFKSMTWEYTFDTELYWMIQQMTWRFAMPETGQKLMGDKVNDFDPSRDYFYKPVSQTVETEQSKTVKVQKLLQFLQVLGPYTQFYANQPQFLNTLNWILQKVATYMGDETEAASKILLNPRKPPMLPQGSQGGASGGGGQGPMGPGMLPDSSMQSPMSNQSGQEQSTAEQTTREGAGGAYY